MAARFPTNTCGGHTSLNTWHTADPDKAKILKCPTQISRCRANRHSILVLAYSDMIIVPVAAYMLPRQNPSIIRLLVLGNELLDGLDVLRLSLLGLQVLELSPLVVLGLALCPHQSVSAADAISSGAGSLTLRSKTPGLVAASWLSPLPCLKRP